MNKLVFIENNQVVTDSLTIAEMFGKEHKNVLRDITTQIEYAGPEFSQLNFEPSEYGVRGKRYLKFNLSEEAFALVVFSYNTKTAVQTKIKFIQEFKRMKEFIQKQTQQPQDPVELALQTSLKNYQEIKCLKSDVEFLKDSMRINGKQEHALKEQGKAKVLEILGGYGSPAYEKLSRKIFSGLWGDFKRHFLLPRSMELAKKDFDEAVEFISTWRPGTTLMMDINKCNRQGQLKLVQ